MQKMSKECRNECVKVVCSINPNILKQLGLDAQIKNALAKAGTPEKPPQAESATQRAAAVEPKHPEEKFVCPDKKIQVIKQERIDPNLTSEILQTLPRRDTIRYTHIIEGTLRSYTEKVPEEDFVADGVEIVLQEAIESENVEDFIEPQHENNEVQSDERIEQSEVIEENIEYIVAEEEVFCEEVIVDFPKEVSSVIVLENQENPSVEEDSQESVQEEVVTEEILQEDSKEVPEQLERSFSDSEESFKGFTQSPEVSVDLHTEISHLQEDSPEESHQESCQSFQQVPPIEEVLQYPAKRFRSLSDTIVCIRSRLSIHREVEESLRKHPEVSESSESTLETSEDSSEDSETSDTSHTGFLLQYLDKDRLIQDILEREKKYLESMMVDQFEDTDLDVTEAEEQVRTSVKQVEVKQEPEIQKLVVRDPKTLNQSVEAYIRSSGIEEDVSYEEPDTSLAKQQTPRKSGSAKKRMKFVPKPVSQILEKPANKLRKPKLTPHQEQVAAPSLQDTAVEDSLSCPNPTTSQSTPDQMYLKRKSKSPDPALKKRKQIEESTRIEEEITFEEPEQLSQLTECDSPESELRGFPEESSFLDTSVSPDATPVHIKPDPDVVRIKVEKESEDLEEPRRSGRSKKTFSVVQKSTEPLPAKASKKRPKNVKFVITDLDAQEPGTQMSDTVTCGRCQVTIPSDSWHQHFLNHNGVAWRVDQDCPIDMDDEQVRARVMQTTIKRCKLGFVRCEKCGETRKSGVGLVSHERTCGKTKEDIESVMITCEHCQRRVRPCSLKSHQTNHCSVLKKLHVQTQRGTESPDQDEAEDTKIVFTDTGRVKRKSTRAAEAKFRRELSPNDEPFAGSGSDASMGTESSDSDGSSGASEPSDMPSDAIEDSPRKKKKKKKKKVSRKPNITSTKILDDSKRVSGPFVSQNWRQIGEKQLMQFYKSQVIEFRSKNHSTEPLFTAWMPQSVPIGENEGFLDYLPKSNTSIYYDQLSVSHYKVAFGGASSSTLSQLECFEGVAEDRRPPILYCGAPVLAFDWLIGAPECVQGEILAISCASSFRSNYAYTHTNPEKTAIQIWNVGCLENRGDAQITFLYGVAFDWGPAFSVKFCPSGGFCPSSRRLSLLAVSSCIGNIVIFSLPLEATQKKILKLTPSVILESRQMSLLTTVAWCEMKGHSFVAGGLSTGRVFVWKLDVQSALLRRRRNNTEIIYPTHTINGHVYPVTVIFFSRIEKRNLLLTGSIDRDIKIYDLSAGGTEISVLNYKSQVTCGAWPLNWPVYVFGIDNTYQWSRTEGLLKHPFSVPHEDSPLIVHTQDLTDLDISDWRNVLVVGLESGDVCANFRQHYGPLSRKGDLYREILSYTDSIIIPGGSGRNIEDSFSFVTENCGILFCDLSKPVDLKATKVFRSRHVAEYPLTRINRIAFNPNESASQYYAVGYQAGFVRLCSVHH